MEKYMQSPIRKYINIYNDKCMSMIWLSNFFLINDDYIHRLVTLSALVKEASFYSGLQIHNWSKYCSALNKTSRLVTPRLKE